MQKVSRRPSTIILGVRVILIKMNLSKEINWISSHNSFWGCSYISTVSWSSTVWNEEMTNWLVNNFVWATMFLLSWKNVIKWRSTKSSLNKVEEDSWTRGINSALISWRDYSTKQFLVIFVVEPCVWGILSSKVSIIHENILSKSSKACDVKRMNKWQRLIVATKQS